MSTPLSRRQVMRAAAGLVAVGVVSTLGGCVGGSAAPAGEGSDTTTLHLVGFAVPKEANNAIQKKFAETPDGKGVVWEESYGASGDQSRAVVNGLKADYVNFSLEGDVTRLVKAGLVAEDWNADATKGIVSDSVVVIVVPKGNPQGIKGWDDLTKDGRQDHHPEPGVVGFGAVEHPGRLPAGDRQRRHRGRRQGVPDRVLRQRRRPAGQRPRRHQRLPRGCGQRADLVRERGHPGAAVG